MKALFLLLICGTVFADAQLIGASTTHLMFNYHGEPLFCPREVESFGLLMCLDDQLKYVVCRMLPRELGFIDCGHKTTRRPFELEAKAARN